MGVALQSESQQLRWPASAATEEQDTCPTNRSDNFRQDKKNNCLDSFDMELAELVQELDADNIRHWTLHNIIHFRFSSI